MGFINHVKPNFIEHNKSTYYELHYKQSRICSNVIPKYFYFTTKKNYLYLTAKKIIVCVFVF